MTSPLRVLCVEDSEDDMLLIVRELRRGGFDLTCERVETAEAMQAALAGQAWDIVLSDFTIPRFGAPAALAVLQESGLDLPFIIVSGSITEAQAVDALRAGADDFIVKTNLTRLVPAVQRELRDSAARRERREMEKRYRAELEEKVRLLEAQQAAIRELSTPVIQLWPGVLILPIVGAIDSPRAAQITEDLLERIVAAQARVVIVDITGVPLVDTGVANRLLKTVRAASLLGAHCLLAGIRPEIAQTVVHLGVDLSGIETYADLQSGLERAFGVMGLQVKREA